MCKLGDDECMSITLKKYGYVLKGKPITLNPRSVFDGCQSGEGHKTPTSLYGNRQDRWIEENGQNTKT